MSVTYSDFRTAMVAARDTLKNWGTDVPVTRWQGVETEGTFREVTFYDFTVSLTRHSAGKPRSVYLYELQDELKPNLPWADDHFQERVGGEPLNPGDQYKNWPYWRESSEQISLNREGRFSHTYMERFWPIETRSDEDGARHTMRRIGAYGTVGNLDDVVGLLVSDPYTRQAYLPIWFPEDTGSIRRERVPCTIGYFFLMRNNRLHMRYHIRSCDFNRYLADDIYMAVRLQMWVLDQLQGISHGVDIWDRVELGQFHMSIDSLHTFGGDFALK